MSRQKNTFAKARVSGKKGFLDLPFSWIFALIVGAIILFGAIYFATRAQNVANTATSAETGSSLMNLLTPLQSDFGAANSITITMPTNSRISHQCDTFGNFGTDTISVEQFLNNRWSNSGVEISSHDKYIFSSDTIQGRAFNAFSEPFSFPFKVADLMYFTNTDTEYCFVNIPSKPEDELKNLNQKNFEFNNCSLNSTRICFNSGSNCDINVDTNQETVEKGGQTVYFNGDALMFAAIFSDQNIYECEVGRLMNRTKILSGVYAQKAIDLQKLGCNSQIDLSGFRAALNSYSGSQDLYKVEQSISGLGNGGECTLW